MASFADQLEKLRQRKELLTILIFLFVIIIFWISIGVFSSQQESGISTEQKKIAEPLSPILDTGVIEKLELKKLYSETELRDFSIFVIIDSQGESVLVDTRDENFSNSVLPPELEEEVQQLEEDIGL